MTAVLQALREVPNTLGAWALDIANRLGKRTYDPRSLDRVEGYARAASVAGDLSRSRGWDAFSAKMDLARDGAAAWNASHATRGASQDREGKQAR